MRAVGEEPGSEFPKNWSTLGRIINEPAGGDISQTDPEVFVIPLGRRRGLHMAIGMVLNC